MNDDRWEYEVRRNSSVGMIARAMTFYEVAADFLEVVRLGLPDEEIEAAEQAIKLLQKAAMAVTRKEAG